MAITREKKRELVQTYVDWLEQSQAIVFVYSRGLKVGEITQLRSRIRKVGSEYHVIKNTLFKRALAQADIPVPDVLTGPVSVAFCAEDIAPTVGAIQDFAVSLGEREFEITGGIVENDLLDAEGAKALASLPSRDTLFVQILTCVNAPATQLAGILANGVRQILSVLQARVDQLKEGDVAA